MVKDRYRIPIDTDAEPDVGVRFHVLIRMLVPARKIKEARSILASVIERVKVKEGCLDCRLYQETMEGRPLLFESVWTDEKCFQAHLRSDEFRYVLLVVEMASKSPEIRFDRIAHSTAIGTIEDIWKKGGSLIGAAPPDPL